MVCAETESALGHDSAVLEVSDLSFGDLVEAVGQDGEAGVDVVLPALGFDAGGAEGIEDVAEDQLARLAVVALASERAGDAVAFAGDELAGVVFQADEEPANHAS